MTAAELCAASCASARAGPSGIRRHRLSFNVDSSPPPLKEWSPFANVTPPHIDGYFKSRRGEFRLIALPGGQTRLEGSTWYEMRLYPAGYWSLFGDNLISRIDQQVLRHSKKEAEATQDG